MATDDIVFEIVDNAAFDSTFRITANPTGFASVTLTVHSSVRHDGTYGSGARLVLSTEQATVCTTLSTINTTIEWLEITTTGSGKISTAIAPPTYAAGKRLTVRHMLLHDNGLPNGGGATFRAVCIGADSNNGGMSCNVDIHNNVIHNWRSGSIVVAIGIGAPTGGVQDVKVYNNTVDGIDVVGGTSGIAVGIYCSNNAAPRWTNNVVTNIGTNTTTGTRGCFYGNGGSSVGANNASSDGTAFGSGSLTNIVRGDNFSTPDSGDFRPLNNDSPIFAAGIDLGTTPTNVNIDGTGRDRDSNNDVWSIGAFQVSAGGAVTPVIAVATPVEFAIRKAVSGSAACAVSGSYAAGPPTGIEYRLNNTGSWADLGATIDGGTWSGTIASLPVGTNVVSVRWTNDTSVTDSVSNVLVGTVYCGCGQSNESNRLSNQQSYTHATHKASVLDQDDLAWRELIAAPTDPENSGGSYHALLATQHLADRNEPCGFITTANGGQVIASWFTTSSQASWNSAKSRITASGTTPTAFLIDIGESDALAATGYSTYRTRLLNWIADINTTFPGARIFIALVGTVGGAVAAGDLDDIRRAQLSVIDPDNGVYLSRCGHDRASLHWTTDAERLTQAARTYLAYQSGLFGGSNGRGPRLSSLELNSARDRIIVTYDRAIKTGLTFATQPWEVSDDGTPAAVSSVTYHATDPNAVEVHLSAALSGGLGTCELKFCGGDTAAGRVIPQSTDIAMPSGTAVQLPAEPFYAETATEYTAPGDVEDLEDNALAAISDFAITNSSAQ